MSTKNAILAHDHLFDVGELDQIEHAASAATQGGPRFLASPTLVLRLVQSYRHALDAWLTSDVEALEATDINADLAARLHETRCALAELARLVSTPGSNAETLKAARALAEEALAEDDRADEDMSNTIGLGYTELRAIDAWAPNLDDDKSPLR